MRPPDHIIGPAGNPQTRRWDLFTIFGWKVALHQWCRSDDDRAPHDHVGHNISILLTGRYRELVREREWLQDGDMLSFYPVGTWTHHGDGEFYRDVDHWHTRYPLVPYFRRASTPHRVALLRRYLGGPNSYLYRERSMWSIWVRGPHVREWGFHCPRGWRPWKEYCDMRDGKGSEVGRGCE